MLSCFIAILQPRDTEMGRKKKVEGKTKLQRCHHLCPLQKMLWLCHLWNTADAAITREDQYSIKDKEVMLWLQKVSSQASIFRWRQIDQSHFLPKTQVFTFPSRLLVILTPLLFLTWDSRGHESWWKFQLCSIQWTRTQQNLRSLSLSLSLSTPQQDTCVAYVHNRTNKDADYLG